MAVIAIARHAIEVDLAHLEPLTLIWMGAMLLALIAGLYMTRSVPPPTPKPIDGHGTPDDTRTPGPI